ncbi:cell surface receptor IPT/TIG domain protein [Streptomyces bingchenggensis BCW-1]|uniref:Cell surface receptor IPT/TIG domain protein n=1 Tax=Streptomyces bingchenggensis (strain BCW-1) TaxID=749414 RepID=D7BSF7_STRBB|nr:MULTISPECIES: IPT/TIG domain-containing protein [Streptomyces]ADI09475.1 cell surface receptor IPT/TIG domain protein [Streptomyces bingchenggensis BCW-1]
MPISPNSGPASGGNTVTITGVNLGGATSVRFGTKSAAITSNTPTQVVVTAPSGSGAVNVTVTTPGGNSNPLKYYYVGLPSEFSLSPAAGPVAGGNTVTIDGTGLSTATQVAFGANSATPTVLSDSEVSVAVPTGTAGSVEVTVTTSGGATDGLSYTYVDTPTVTAATPNSGPPTGGTQVTVTGTALDTTQSVAFDGTSAAFVVLDSTTLITTATPTADGGAGPGEIEVTTLAGTATVAYTYVAGPGI